MQGKMQSEAPLPSILSLSDLAVFAGHSKSCGGKHDSVPFDLQPLQLPENCLKPGNIRVLNQIDGKFIAMVIASTQHAGAVLTLVDQHAADERVRLEELREKYLGGQAVSSQQSMGNMKQCVLQQARTVTVTPTEAGAWELHRKPLEEWGWRCRPCNSTSLLLLAVPLIEGKALSAADFREHLVQITETKCIRAPPPALLRLLISKACRSAIMFGDTLLQSECVNLVDQLACTCQPLQCAHGRPTLSPIVSLKSLHACLHALAGNDKVLPRISSQRLKAQLNRKKRSRE
mmetsp:Transcript_42944/g.80476  ORF Transcript_42944/g.80476 Transcript_42944/m.80476 type:complete len:289 (+) Transcript_42944:783-1649(+)